LIIINCAFDKKFAEEKLPYEQDDGSFVELPLYELFDINVINSGKRPYTPIIMFLNELAGFNITPSDRRYVRNTRVLR